MGRYKGKREAPPPEKAGRHASGGVDMMEEPVQKLAQEPVQEADHGTWETDPFAADSGNEASGGAGADISVPFAALPDSISLPSAA